MKLLVICQYFYPERFRVNDICFELVNQGHDVTVLTGLPNYPSGIVPNEYKKIRYEEINGVKVIRSWLIGRGDTTKQLFLNYLTFAITSSLKALTLNDNFDRILVYQLSPVTMALPGVIVKKRKKIPLIIYCHDLWPESISSGGIVKKGFIYKIVKFVSKSLYKNADYLWYSSKMFDNYFKEYLKIEKPNQYLPSYAESLFDNITYESDKTIDLVFAGNIGEMQSVETVIQAADYLKEYNNIKFHIVGDGSAKKQCELLSKELNINNVIFYGSKPLQDMPYYYSLADAFLVTLKDNEVISYTLPNKVQSYLAAGKPILASAFGETKEVIEAAKCGFVSYPTDAKSLAENILKFANMQIEEKLNFGKNARRYYETKFSRLSYFESFNEYLKLE